MRKILFIMSILSIVLMGSCKKESVVEPMKLLSVEVYINTNQPTTVPIEITLTSDGVNVSESKTIELDGSSIVFKKELYIYDNQILNLDINVPDNTTVSVYGFTREGHKTFRILESYSALITLTDNNFKDVVITEI